MRSFLLYSLLISGLFITSCQDARNLGPDPGDVFVKYYGGGFDQSAVDLEIEENGFVILGNTRLNSLSETPEPILIWTDKGGNELTSRKLASPLAVDFVLSSALRVKDDNYFIAGTAYKGDDRDVWVSVQNREGNPTLANDFIFGTDDYLEEAADVLILEDNSFLILGSTTNIDENKWKGVVDANDSTDILLLKVNSQGNLLWRKRLGYGGKDVGVKIEKMENGNFAILGNSKIGTDSEIFIALLNPDGNVYNTRNLKPGRQNKALGLDYKNGLLSLSGSADGVAYLESLDQSLITQSEFSANSIYSTEISSEINSVISTEEGTLLITATWSKENREKDASVLLLGANGKKIWQDPLFFGSEEDDQSVMALPLDQDKYLLLGNFKFGSNTMMGLLKISEIGLK